MDFEPATEDVIAEDWREFSAGPPVFGALREYTPSEVEGLVCRHPDGTKAGLVTWWLDGETAEVVSLHAVPQGRGTGARLMDAAEAELKRRGVRRAILVTTNDNVRALAFYARRGYRLVRLHLDAMERVRQAKPDVPETGAESIPLRDMWELEKCL